MGVSPVQYGYDAASRLNAVTNGSYTAGYAYLPNSSLVSNLVFMSGGTTRMTTTKTWDNLNRLSTITSSAGVTNVASFAYQYNSANQRTQVTLADGSYWVYTYDSLGQVTSGSKYWPDASLVSGQQFGYAFDTIGNRKTATFNSNTGTYTENSLNEYTQRTVPGYVWELGNAASNATVTVNLQPTTRKGQYFSEELSVNNSSSAVYTQLVTVGVLKDAGSNQQDIVTSSTGKVFVAQSPEPFGYDLDGDLTNDGRWAYTWDGENRLAQMQTLTNLPASVPQEKLLFGYDYQGRRVSKVVSNFNGSSWSAISNLRSVYDGWNLIAELNSTNGLVRSYTWGLDLSGSPQGAGGIGGLLLISYQGSPVTNSFVALDGNGNVSALVDAGTGSVSGQFEYGPFGETVRADGPVAKANPFRFSTKYTDAETGLLYYGNRYYNPSTGRWLSRDPLGEGSDGNLYRFVKNNPVLLIDPLGLCCCCVEELYVTANLIDKRPGLLGGVYKYDITVSAGLGYKCTGKNGDCTLKWTEENHSDSSGLMNTPGGWLPAGESWTGDAFDGWKPKSECPGGVTADMPTPHGFALYFQNPPKTATSHLVSDVTVSSSDATSCKCNHKQMRVRIETRLRLVNSVPDKAFEGITITHDP